MNTHAPNRNSMPHSVALLNGAEGQGKRKGLAVAARPHRRGVTGWCDRRKARTWSIVFSSKSFGSRQGNTVDCAFGASAAMSTDV